MNQAAVQLHLWDVEEVARQQARMRGHQQSLSGARRRQFRPILKAFNSCATRWGHVGASKVPPIPRS